MGESGSWKQIRALTERMLDRAQNADWASVGEASARRDQLLETFFAAPLHEGDSESVCNKVEQVMAIDRETMSLAEGQHDALVDRRREIESPRERDVPAPESDKK